MSEVAVEVVEPKKHIRRANGKLVHECLYVEYMVKHPEGQVMNEILYKGLVSVPTCEANMLNEQDQHWANAEKSLFSNRGKTVLVAQLKE